MTAPGANLPGMEVRKPPEGVELRILTLEVDEELEAKGEGLEKGIGKAVISRIGVVDSYGDVIEQGAFTRAVVDLLPNHSWNSPYPPIGALTAMPKKGQEEVVGRWALNLETMLGKEWLAHLRFAAEQGKKAIQEFSIGFRALKSKWLSSEEREKRKDNAWRIIQKLELLECSLVVAGAMPGTKIIEMRQRKFDDECEERERAIRDADPDETALLIGADLKKRARMSQDFPRQHHFF